MTTIPARRAWHPMLTYGLIAVNVIAFAFSAKESGSIQYNVSGPNVAELALSEAATANGWWWTAITSGFLHFGPLHLAVNMFTLYIFGQNIEYALGRGRFAAIYAVSLLGGSASVLWFGLENTVTVGASGAIFGLMGAQLLLSLRTRTGLQSMVAIIAINVIASFTFSGISLFGHLGGLAAGAAAAAGVIYLPELLPRERRTAQRVALIGWVAIAVVGVIVVAAIAVRFATYPAPTVYTIRYR